MASTSIVNEASKKHVKYKSERYLERIHGLRQKLAFYFVVCIMILNDF